MSDMAGPSSSAVSVSRAAQIREETDVANP
jgi:hypothetical protein